MGGKTAIRDTVRHDLTPPWAGPIRCNPFYRNFGAWGIRSRPETGSIFPSVHRAGPAISGWTAWGTGYTEADLKARLEAIRTGPASAARTAAPGVPVAVPWPEIPGPGRIPTPRPPETAWVSSPVLQIPVSSPLLPEGPSADTGGLFPRARNLLNWTAINGSFAISTKIILKQRSSCPCNTTLCKRRSTPSRTGAGTCTVCGGPAMRRYRRRSAILRPNCGRCAAT